MIGRIGAFRLLFAGLCFCSSATLLRADVFVQTLQDLTQLSFASSAGSVVFLGSNEGTAFGKVSDSLGGADQQTQSGNGSVTIDASTPVVFVNFTSVGGGQAIGTADAGKLTSDNFAGAQMIIIPGSATAQSTNTITGSFEITGTSAPATLNVLAALQINNTFAETDVAGISGSSEAIFKVMLGNGDTPVALDHLINVGPSQQQEFTLNQTLTGSSLLQPDTPYSFTIVQESDATAVNGLPPTPEPSYLVVSIFLLSGVIALRHARSRSRVPRA